MMSVTRPDRDRPGLQAQLVFLDLANETTFTVFFLVRKHRVPSTSLPGTSGLQA